MAGVKQFDESEVLDRAMRLFWRHGYAATSIRDLTAGTGINRGSLYAAFGSKQRLFLAVLDYYAEKVGNPLMRELADPDPRRAIEQMLESIIKRTSDPKWPRGCLQTNTALECPNVGDEISRKIAERFGQQESAIYRMLRRAQAAGLIDQAGDARALARFFTGVAHALNVVNKASADPAILRDMVKVALSVLDIRKHVGPKSIRRKRETRRD